MSERSRERAFLSESAVYLFSNTLNALIPFALLPVLTRYLDPTQYGEVAMFQTIVVGFTALIGLSLPGAAGRKYYDFDSEHSELRHYIGACFQLLLVSSTIVLVALLFWQDALSAWLGVRTQWLPWALVASLAGLLFQMRMTQWQVRREPTKYGIAQVGQSFLNMGVSILLVMVLRRGADGRIEALIAVPLGMAVLALILLYRDGLLGMAWRPQYIGEAAKYGVPLVPHGVGLFLLSTVDRFIVNRELGIAQAGIYMVAVQLAMGLALVFDSVNSSYVPWLYERLKRDVDTEKREIVRWTYMYFAFALACAGAAFAIGPFVVTTIAGAKYAGAGKALGWLALGQAFAGMYLAVTNYIFYSKRTGLLSLTTICSGLFTLALLPILTRAYGLVGASVAFAAGMLVRFLLTWWVAQRRHPMPWFESFSHRMREVTANAQ